MKSHGLLALLWRGPEQKWPAEEFLEVSRAFSFTRRGDDKLVRFQGSANPTRSPEVTAPGRT